jgi:SAM-dependent methyltransferase
MTDPDAVRRAYDAVADDYDAARGEGTPGLDRVRAFLDDCSPGARVLDAGCGGGRPVLSALSSRADAVGLDLSRGQLGLAADRVPGTTLVQGSVTDLPFPAGTFHAVTAYHVLIHVPLADHGSVLAEFARVLRPGGRLLVTEGELRWQGRNPDWLGADVEMAWSMAGPGATREHLSAAGFEVLDAWRVPDTLGAEDDGDGEVPEDGDEEPPEDDGDGDGEAPAGKPFFLARRRD